MLSDPGSPAISFSGSPSSTICFPRPSAQYMIEAGEHGPCQALIANAGSWNLIRLDPDDAIQVIADGPHVAFRHKLIQVLKTAG